MCRLSLKIYKSFVINQIGLFVLLTLGIGVSMLGMIFVYNRGLLVYKNNAFHNNETKTLSVEFEEELDSEEIDKMMSFFFNKTQGMDIQECVGWNQGEAIYGYYCKENPRITIPYGRFFDEYDLYNNVVLLSDVFLADQNAEFISTMLNSNIYLEKGDEYKVIGRYHATLSGNVQLREVIIPLFTYVKNSYKFDNLKLIFADVLSEQQINKIKVFFDEMQILYSYNPPLKYEYSALKMFVEEISTHLIVLFITFLTVINILHYWIILNKKRFSIYYVCGCTKFGIVKLIIYNIFYLFSFPALISWEIYYKLESFFSDIDFITKLRVRDYLGIYLFMFIVMVISTGSVLMIKKNKLILLGENDV